MSRRWAVLAAVILISCGGSSSASGVPPLGSSADEPTAVVCGQLATNSLQFAEGQTVLTNTGSVDVTIASIELVDAENARIVAVYAYDPSVAGLVGFHPGGVDALDPALVETLVPVEPRTTAIAAGTSITLLVVAEALSRSSTSRYERLVVEYFGPAFEAAFESDISLEVRSTPCDA